MNVECNRAGGTGGQDSVWCLKAYIRDISSLSYLVTTSGKIDRVVHIGGWELCVKETSAEPILIMEKVVLGLESKCQCW